MSNKPQFIPAEVVSNLSDSYKSGSIKAFSSSIKRLHKLFDIESFDLDFLLDEDKILSALTEPEFGIPPNSRKTLLNAVIRVLEHSVAAIPENYQKKLDELMQESFSEQKTIKQSVSLREIDTIMHKLRPNADSNRSNHLKHFVIALYRYIPPLRAADYRSVKISADTYSGGHNYWDPEKETLYLDSGSRIIKFPDSLARITKEWLTHNDTEWLIPDRNNSQMTQQAFTDMINRIFERPVSISEIRKNYIKRYISRLNPERRAKLAELMDHSIDTQSSYIEANYNPDASSTTGDAESDANTDTDSEDELVIDMQ